MGSKRKQKKKSTSEGQAGTQTSPYPPGKRIPPNNPPPQTLGNAEPRRVSVEVDTQTSHAEIRRLSLVPKDIPKPLLATDQPVQKSEAIETQTSHAAIRRLSQGGKDIPRPLIIDQADVPKVEAIETQTPHGAIRRLSQGGKDIPKPLLISQETPNRAIETQTIPPGIKKPPRQSKDTKKSVNPKVYPDFVLPIKTQTSDPNVKRISREPKYNYKPGGSPAIGYKPPGKLKPGKPLKKPVRSLEEVGGKLKKVKSNKKIPGEAVGVQFEEDWPRRKSEDADNKPPRKSQEPRRDSQEEQPTKLIGPRKSRKSLGRRQSQFQFLEDDTYVTPKESEKKPQRNIFRRLADTVSSIFLGPKYSDEDDSPGSKVKPVPLKDAGPEVSTIFGPPKPVLDPKDKNVVRVNPTDEGINRELSLILDYYKEASGKGARKVGADDKSGKFSYEEIMSTLRKQGIPLPSDEDFARLENSHGQRWDPHGTVLEYYSPVLRSFIPLNMRGRYRGCYAGDQCVKGLDISKLAPKPDALEGYVDRGRQYRIQAIYDAMEPVALSEDHLDYLVEVYKTQVMLLPIPIFYDVLNLGCDTLNWNIKILQSKEGIPPHNKIYSTTEDRAVSMQKKLQIYAALGLEPLFNPRKGMGKIHPQWTKTRDELITSLINRQNELERERQRVMQEQKDKPLKKKEFSHTSLIPQEFDKTISLASISQKPRDG